MNAGWAWGFVVLAGVLEVVWATLMKQSEGFTRVGATVATVLTMIASFLLLSQAMRTLPLGTAYAVWTGIGAVGAALVGILWLGEPRTAARLVCIVAIVGGILGLKATSGA